MITHYSGLSRIVPNFPMFRGMHPVLSHHPYRDQLVRWSSGRCTYIPRRTVDRADLLSERSFLYGKDADYCKRISDAGLLRIRVPAAACGYHETARSSVTEPLEELLENGAQPLPDVGTMWGKEFRPLGGDSAAVAVHASWPASRLRLTTDWA
jgi:hypothetical protein